MLNLKGIFPPIATPFTTDGSVDFAHLESNLQRWLAQPIDGFVVSGSNGESALLSSQEKLDLVKTARQVIPRDRLLIAGTGMEATRATIELTNGAAQAGADIALIVTPHYYKSRMDGAAQLQHFHMVADMAAIPLIIYNVPGFTGIDLSADVIVELSQHPNIIGVKENSGAIAKIAEIVSRTPDHFNVLAGSGSYFLPALAVGAVGGIMALVQVAAQACADIHHLVRQGDWSAARAIHHRMLAPNATITSQFGVAGLKAALDLLGYYGGPVRPPLRLLTEAELHRVRQIFTTAGLLPTAS
ncbi:MAG: dihydrodipicolinate synthase family protein [Chloroflexi bacterium]|nr:dihydrodipicolinate synthase family protein [Chloroflexota bacterium]